MPTFRRLLLLAPLALGLGNAATLYEESVSGDLSTSSGSPSSLSFGFGSNVVHGTTGRDGNTQLVDRDYFTFVVPAGGNLQAITILTGTIGGGTGSSFIGIGSGASLLDPTTAVPTLAASLLGYTLYSSADIGNNILPRLAASGGSAPPAIGFSSLGPGTYTLWVQETGTGSFNYALDVVITPEPATWGMMAAAFAGIAALRRRR